MATLHLHATTQNQLNFPNDPVEVVVPNYADKLAEFEKQLSDVCDFANKAVPMLCETMQRNEEALIKLTEAHNAHVDDVGKSAMDMAVKIDEEFEKRDAALQVGTSRLDAYRVELDRHQAEFLDIHARLRADQQDSSSQEQIQALGEKITLHMDGFDRTLDMHAEQVSQLEAALRAHRFAMYVGLAIVSVIAFAALYRGIL